jgi:hypothetical protein
VLQRDKTLWRGNPSSFHYDPSREAEDLTAKNRESAEKQPEGSSSLFVFARFARFAAVHLRPSASAVK